MRIVLTRDINPRKGWVRGQDFDWPRSTITSLERQLGGSDWYEWAGAFVADRRRRSMDEEKRPRRGRRSKKEETNVAPAPSVAGESVV